MMPAFNPNATRARTNIAVFIPGPKLSGAKGDNVNEPLAADSKPKRANRHNVATCVATR